MVFYRKRIELFQISVLRLLSPPPLRCQTVPAPRSFLPPPPECPPTTASTSATSPFYVTILLDHPTPRPPTISPGLLPWLEERTPNPQRQRWRPYEWRSLHPRLRRSSSYYTNHNINRCLLSLLLGIPNLWEAPIPHHPIRSHHLNNYNLRLTNTPLQAQSPPLNTLGLIRNSFPMHLEHHHNTNTSSHRTTTSCSYKSGWN